MTVITGTKASTIRRKFLDSFVDKNSMWYIEILSQVKSSGGSHYYGYLWDCFYRNNLHVFFMEEIDKYLHHSEVYLCWDNHPSNYFTMQVPSWGFPKNSLLKLSGSEVKSMMPCLPQDFYLFDATFSWAIAVTHEESTSGKSICYYVLAD